MAMVTCHKCGHKQEMARKQGKPKYVPVHMPGKTSYIPLITPAICLNCGYEVDPQEFLNEGYL